MQMPHETKGKRPCLMTGGLADKASLIRFVQDGEGKLTFDLAQKLGGRGAWVRANRHDIEQAIEQNKFARQLKSKIIIPASLIDNLEKGLRQRLLDRLCMMNKAGLIVAGANLIKQERIEGLLVADDASARETDKLCQITKPKYIEKNMPAAILGQVKKRDSIAYLGIKSATNIAHTRGIKMMHADLKRWRGLVEGAPNEIPNETPNETHEGTPIHPAHTHDPQINKQHRKAECLS